MEWGFKENRLAVIALHKRGKSDSQIFELSKPLKISRNFIYRAIKRYEELWGVENRARSGRL
jgi:transposase